MSLKLSSNISELKGVGEVRRKALSKMGIETVFDLLHHFPRAYQNRGDTKTLSEISEGSEGAVSVILCIATQPTFKMIRRGMSILKFKAFDENGTVEITYFNQNYLKDVFSVGAEFRFWGKIYKEKGALKMTSPIYEPYVDGIPLPSLVPVYPVTAGISQKFISGIISDAWDKTADELPDVFNSSILEKYSIVPIKKALGDIHFPKTPEQIEEGKKRLNFEETFLVACALALEKSCKSGELAPAIQMTCLDEYTKALPYELTGAQKRSLDEICSDISKTSPMRRILIGDVGSGKTAVAAGAAYAAVKSGYQCAIMVPTEILARQHYDEMRPLFSKFGINVELLCGSTPAADKKRIQTVVSGKIDLTGGIDILIGTHALISEGVNFAKLGLVITDEQHRFGVMQRAALASKTNSVHILAMSATPIPRTLSLVCYGDLSVSRLDEMPPGRQKVDTFVVDERYRDRINRFIRTHARAGNRIYVVCPMVDDAQIKNAKSLSDKINNDPEEMADIIMFDNDSEKVPMKSTVGFAKDLALRLPDLKIGMLNGKMKSAQKDAVMRDFADGKIQVLVSTTVIEVGVNIPDATLMIVENAERFGLSQLHQLRGRVGRGQKKSFCILVSDSKSEVSKRRLSVMKNTCDGYEIAESDLKLRGAGDFFASQGRFRQHGAASSFIFSGLPDNELSELAVSAAHETVTLDPELSKPENLLLKEQIRSLRQGIENTIN